METKGSGSNMGQGGMSKNVQQGQGNVQPSKGGTTSKESGTSGKTGGSDKGQSGSQQVSGAPFKKQNEPIKGGAEGNLQK